MSMGVMYERLGEFMFEEWRKRNQQVTYKRYWNEFVDKKRVSFRGLYDFSIQALPEWNHRFFGVTKDGIPIWGKKRRQYKYIGADVCASVRPQNQSEVYQDDKECQSEEVTSFVKWKKGKQKLAFIYLGVFCTLEEGENLNDAAKRFIMSHQEVKRQFRKRRKSGENSWVSEEKIYLYELFRDGALVFCNGKAFLKEEYIFFDTISGLWAIMVAEGFFADENIEQVDVGTNFFSWYTT